MRSVIKMERNGMKVEVACLHFSETPMKGDYLVIGPDTYIIESRTFFDDRETELFVSVA